MTVILRTDRIHNTGTRHFTDICLANLLPVQCTVKLRVIFYSVFAYATLCHVKCIIIYHLLYCWLCCLIMPTEDIIRAPAGRRLRHAENSERYVVIASWLARMQNWFMGCTAVTALPTSIELRRRRGVQSLRTRSSDISAHGHFGLSTNAEVTVHFGPHKMHDTAHEMIGRWHAVLEFAQNNI